MTGANADYQSNEEARHLLEGELNISPSNTILSNAQTAKPTPLPWNAVTVILILNAIQPLTFELVFPFINQMILEIGVVDDPERVGFYSGVIESLFAVMSFIFVIPCSMLSDSHGRKPIVLISIGILSISTALFGFSKSYWFMILTRATGGIVSASWTTMKVMLAEITDKSNQGQAFAAFGAAFKIGQILGQPIGGLLSHPERNFPIFDNNFWRTYPYAFPCLFSASIAVLAVFSGCFTLKETKLKAPQAKNRPNSYGSLSSEDNESALPADKPAISWTSALAPYVLSVMASLSAMTLSSEMLFGLYPLFAFTPVVYGGLGCNEAEIGIHMVVRAVICIFFMCFFAPLQNRIGTLRTFQITMFSWPLCVLCLPFLNIMKRWEVGSITMDAVLCAYFAIWGFAHLSWSASAVLINDSSPSAEHLSAINGISQMAISLPEAISPALATSLFAWSISSNILGGYLVWIVLFAIALMSSIHCLTLKEATHDWREDLRASSI